MNGSRVRLGVISALPLSVVTVWAMWAAGIPREDLFNHPAHASLFPSCATCHAGAQQAGRPIWPAAISCNACHDGQVEETIDWTPRTELPPTNLRFDHQEHAAVLVSEGRDAAACIDCHSESGAPWMTVRLAAVDQCLDCHDITVEHLVAPDSACATCHLPLPEATRITKAQIAAFSAPSPHEADDYASAAAHGAEALPAGGSGVSASCATCHARDFCIECHVDAPEQTTIQALGADPRSLAIPASLLAPTDHEAADFLGEHGGESWGTPSNCTTCHTQESCVTCHVATQQVASSMYQAAPGRGIGAIIQREPPGSHEAWYRNAHGDEASANAETCAGCHARQDCLDCHRPDPASGPPGYHPDGFLTAHPAAAYDRVTSCSDCHNAGSFCATCHEAAGLTNAAGQLGAGYHDAKQFFIVGHGPAARQNLESCVSCHTETDCLTCHSATGGRRVNPHGPGFDAERLAKRASQMCTVCHLVVPR